MSHLLPRFLRDRKLKFSAPHDTYLHLRSPRLKYLTVATLVSFIALYLLLYSGSATTLQGWRAEDLSGSIKDALTIPGLDEWKTRVKRHPIDDLVLSARANFKRLLKKQSHDVDSAARAYRKRRGRHPPPGFDAWFAYAQSKDAVIVEDFFDRIHHDLNPFWALDPKLLRYQAHAYEFVVSVRDHGATYKTDDKKRVPWIQLWHGLIEELADFLPDVDVPVNMMDESRLIVPWEDIDDYMKKAEQARKIADPTTVVSNFTGLTEFDAEESMQEQEYDPQFGGGQYWELARRGCSPDSPSRNMPAWFPIEEPTLFPSGRPQNSTAGFVSNWTLAKGICDKPHMRGLHGSFIEPVSVSTSQKLIPLFGGSKLGFNNEILLPPATYLNSDPMYSGGEAHGGSWEYKKNSAIWRGVASGGRNRAENWIHFQRHRFLQMTNGTRILEAEQTDIRPETFDLPKREDYDLVAQRHGYLGDWIRQVADTAFIDLLCFPGTPDAHCPYTDPFFSIKDGMPMRDMYAHKYLPDIDGNSFSGRYRAFLLSTSLPIKATVYEEWHDDRLFPWVHFVPMDNTFQDIWAILEYFLGGAGEAGSRDEVGRRIALEGKAWAEQVLRREDMAVYVYRLLLEWARVCDDQRERMGWVGDLL